MSDYWAFIAVAGCIIQAAFICTEYAKRYLAALILKGLASLLFVTLGIACFSAASDAVFGWLVMAGLVFGMAGDVLLNLRKIAQKSGDKIFSAGIAAFLIGHLLYSAALLSRGADALLVAVPLCALLSGVLTPFVLRRIDVEGKLKMFGIVYVTVVLFMTSCAAGLLIIKPFDYGHLLFTAGAVLFTLSDVILIFDLFGRKKRRAMRAFNLSTYYAGQVLIALSLLWI